MYLLQVSEKLNAHLKLLQKVQALQDELLPMARRGAVLYIILKSLGSVNSYHGYKLDEYMKTFTSSLGAGDLPPDDLELDDSDRAEAMVILMYIICNHIVLQLLKYVLIPTKYY